MDRALVALSSDDLNAVAPIDVNGSLNVSTGALSRLIARSTGLVGVRVAVSNADYAEHQDGTPEPRTRTVGGVWWHPRDDDTAVVGGFTVDGLAMTITTEGEDESPLATGVEILDRATRAIASQYEGAEILETGLMRVPVPSGWKPARVVVTRDHRIRRPQDLLQTDERVEFEANRFGLAIVQVIGGDKAIVTKHGV